MDKENRDKKDDYDEELSRRIRIAIKERNKLKKQSRDLMSRFMALMKKQQEREEREKEEEEKDGQ